MSTTKINRTEFVNQLSNKLAISKIKAEESLTALIDLITENLTNGCEVNLTGFGVFRIVERKERDGVNPKTGEKMKIKASKGISFKVGKTFKEAVKNS
jgi:nucleoid DNA-binding protein